jgi:hypothetical protein
VDFKVYIEEKVPRDIDGKNIMLVKALMKKFN